MVGMNKFSDKERRKARRSFQSDRYKEDLRTPKYRKRVEPNRRSKEEDFNYEYE